MEHFDVSSFKSGSIHREKKHNVMGVSLVKKKIPEMVVAKENVHYFAP